MDTFSTAREISVRVGALVRADSSLAEIQTLGGSLIATDALGPGVVSEVGPAGEVKVHWARADLDAWVQAQDLLQFGENARLVTVRVFGRLGRGKAARHEVVKGAGLRYNWVVEVRPRNILRAIRPDGQTWTFEWYPLFQQAHPIHTLLMDHCQLNDDQAEALTVAEIAARVK
ncbi:MAG: hypothetical protein WCD37_17585 [Chloroflexia bacterium]